jgi:hypothetical protein
MRIFRLQQHVIETPHFLFYCMLDHRHQKREGGTGKTGTLPVLAFLKINLNLRRKCAKY